MYNGKHVLIVYDDLSKTSRSPPWCRFFVVHRDVTSQGMSLSTAFVWTRSFKFQMVGGAHIGLPIHLKQAGDISAYIATNVISVQDGQIFLQDSLF